VGLFSKTARLSDFGGCQTFAALFLAFFLKPRDMTAFQDFLCELAPARIPRSVKNGSEKRARVINPINSRFVGHSEVGDLALNLAPLRYSNTCKQCAWIGLRT
jgi:hypothetical protein